MMRDDLLRQLSALPPEVDVGIQIGDDHLDIADLVCWGDGFVVLTCHSGDLRDVLCDRDRPSQRTGIQRAADQHVGADVPVNPRSARSVCTSGVPAR
jgi:hypothetical protein